MRQEREERQEKRGAQCVLITEHLFNREPCRCSGQHWNRDKQTQRMTSNYRTCTQRISIREHTQGTVTGSEQAAGEDSTAVESRKTSPSTEVWVCRSVLIRCHVDVASLFDFYSFSSTCQEALFLSWLLRWSLHLCLTSCWSHADRCLRCLVSQLDWQGPYPVRSRSQGSNAPLPWSVRRAGA